MFIPFMEIFAQSLNFHQVTKCVKFFNLKVEMETKSSYNGDNHKNKSNELIKMVVK